MDITIGNRSDATGRWNFVEGADGDVSFDETEAHAVVTSILEHRKSYWADANHGSDLHTLKSLTSRTPSQAEAMVREALTQLEQQNRIVVAKIAAKKDLNTGRLYVNVAWTTPGKPEIKSISTEV
jgi:hypothetical protein